MRYDAPGRPWTSTTARLETRGSIRPAATSQFIPLGSEFSRVLRGTWPIDPTTRIHPVTGGVSCTYGTYCGRSTKPSVECLEADMAVKHGTACGAQGFSRRTYPCSKAMGEQRETGTGTSAHVTCHTCPQRQ